MLKNNENILEEKKNLYTSNKFNVRISVNIVFYMTGDQLDTRDQFLDILRVL